MPEAATPRSPKTLSFQVLNAPIKRDTRIGPVVNVNCKPMGDDQRSEKSIKVVMFVEYADAFMKAFEEHALDAGETMETHMPVLSFTGNWRMNTWKPASGEEVKTWEFHANKGFTF